MRRTLKKGFTLIELMVVIAIIGILATTLAPKLREQLAKAKDSKAVSFLGASRTVASSLIISAMTNDDGGSAIVDISWDKLKKQLDVTTKGLMTGGNLIIGGSRLANANDSVKYGGQIALVSIPNGTITTTKGVSLAGLSGTATTAGISDASNLHLDSSNTQGSTDAGKISTEGKAWLAY